MTQTRALPRLSFVMVADSWETARRVVAHLGSQTVAQAIEVVVVAASASDVVVPAAIGSELWGVTVVGHQLVPFAGSRAAGIRVASAEIVVIGETHVFPEADWAERLLAAHSDGWTAVTPAIVNANPGSTLGEAALHLDYGRFGPSRPRGRTNALPRTNASYARAGLLVLGGGLEASLGPLGRLPLPEGGAFHEPAARIAHLNVSRPLDWARERYLAGRLVGGTRFVGFSTRKRVAYALAAPFVAAVIFGRALRLLGRTAAPRPGLVAALALAAVLQAAGETRGYLTGRLDEAEHRMARYELFKWRYVDRGRA